LLETSLIPPELMPLARGTAPVLAYAVAADLFLLAWFAVLLTPAYSQDRKQIFGIEYICDESPPRSRWAVNNDGARVPFGVGWTRGEQPLHQVRHRVSPLSMDASLYMRSSCISSAPFAPVVSGEHGVTV
jgi:hypothetical protein